MTKFFTTTLSITQSAPLAPDLLTITFNGLSKRTALQASVRVDGAERAEKHAKGYIEGLKC